MPDICRILARRWHWRPLRYVFTMRKPGADTEQAGARPRWRKFAWVLAIFVGLASVIIAVAYVERRPIAALLVQTYLLKYGITSTVAFNELSRGGFIAH